MTSVRLECFHDANGNGSHVEDTGKSQNSLGPKYKYFRADKKIVFLIDELLLNKTCQQPNTAQTLAKKPNHGDSIHELKNYIAQCISHWSYTGIYIN